MAKKKTLTGSGSRYGGTVATKVYVRVQLHPDLNQRVDAARGTVAKSYLIEELVAQALTGPVTLQAVVKALKERPTRRRGPSPRQPLPPGQSIA